MDVLEPTNYVKDETKYIIIKLHIGMLLHDNLSESLIWVQERNWNIILKRPKKSLSKQIMHRY